MLSSEHAIILFDGQCLFCDRSVQFIIARDRRAYFKFAPLQSTAGQQFQIDPDRGRAVYVPPITSLHPIGVVKSSLIIDQ